jgi:hypothetical protein
MTVATMSLPLDRQQLHATTSATTSRARIAGIDSCSEQAHVDGAYVEEYIKARDVLCLLVAADIGRPRGHARRRSIRLDRLSRAAASERGAVGAGTRQFHLIAPARMLRREAAPRPAHACGGGHASSAAAALMWQMVHGGFQSPIGVTCLAWQGATSISTAATMTTATAALGRVAANQEELNVL